MQRRGSSGSDSCRKITALITASGIATGLFLGTFLAIARNSKNKITSTIAKGYINLFRAVPLLVVLAGVGFVMSPLIDPPQAKQPKELTNAEIAAKVLPNIKDI